MTIMNRIMAALILTAVFVYGCSSDGSDEAQSILKNQATVTENYVNGLADAKTAEDVAAAIENYTQGMKKLIPELLEFNEKYPEFKQGKMPEGMESEVNRLKEVSAKIPQAMMKTTSFMMNPKVQAAMEQMGKEMSKLSQ